MMIRDRMKHSAINLITLGKRLIDIIVLYGKSEIPTLVSLGSVYLYIQNLIEIMLS